MGELVEAAKALSAPATKLIEVVSRGIGRAYDPVYKRRMADATAYEIDTISGAVLRNGDLPILLDRDGIQMDARSIQELAERAESRMVFQEIRKQQNIEAIVDKAYEELKDEEAVTNEPVDDDWVVRFFNSVEDISNEDLQEIWGRILAGEIRKPKNISMRSLDVLKNISKDEAILFERIANISFYQHNQAFIPRDDELLEKFNVKYNDLFLLSSAGILSHTPLDLGIKMGEDPGVIHNNHIVGVFNRITDTGDALVKLSIYKFTEAGKQILSIIKPDELRCMEFALKYLKTLNEKVKSCNVAAFKISKIEADLIFHDTTNLI